MKAFSILCLGMLSAFVGRLSAQTPVDPNFVVGRVPGAPLASLGLGRDDLGAANDAYRFGYVEITKYLNATVAVVTGTFDDTSPNVAPCIESLDKYGVKASLALNTASESIVPLWPLLREAIENGHEISSHSRRHPCHWESTISGDVIPKEFCRRAYNWDELVGSRNDILANTQQPYVWSFVYPCGNCADFEFVHRRLAEVGYLAARVYPDETRGGALQPGLDTWAFNSYQAGFTQAIQKQGGVAPAGMVDVKVLNGEFDRVLEAGGVYHMVSHPAWLDFGEESFFEKHLKHVGGRKDVWYVPFGPLYAYRTLVEHSAVMRLSSKGQGERFAVAHDLDPEIYSMSVTIKFRVPAEGVVEVRTGGKKLEERTSERLTDRWDEEYVRREGDRLFVTLRPPAVVELR